LRKKLVKIDTSMAMGEANSIFSPAYLVKRKKLPILTITPDPPTTANFRNSSSFSVCTPKRSIRLVNHR